MEFVFLVTGCSLGGVLRYLIMIWIAEAHSSRFPWETLVVNMLGSAFLGGILGFCSLECLRTFFGIGFCGGFTTFSTFSLQNLSLISRGSWGLVFLNCFSSLTVCVGVGFGAYYWLGGLG